MKLELTKIEAATLEDAYIKASSQLECSITDLEFEIIQNPSKGFLGIGKKMAIIVVAKKHHISNNSNADKFPRDKKERFQQNRPEEKRVAQKPQVPRTEESAQQSVQPQQQAPRPEPKIQEPKVELDRQQPQRPNSAHFEQKFSGIENGFFDEKKDISDICHEIEAEVNRLFEISCFDLDRIAVTPETEDTVLVKFTGADSALLIGKEGYRYNALSYLLFNWINPRYKVGVKLEIAEFLHNQEEMVKKYIESVVVQVRSNGQARTKPLDGVLLQIAIKELRIIFPEKYVGVKTSENGAKFVVINDFSRK